MGDWNLWFLRLSGWPVFLIIVAVVVAMMLGASVVLTKLASRSAVQVMLLSVIALIALTLALGIVVLQFVR